MDQESWYFITAEIKLIFFVIVNISSYRVGLLQVSIFPVLAVSKLYILRLSCGSWIFCETKINFKFRRLEGSDVSCFGVHHKALYLIYTSPLQCFYYLFLFISESIELHSFTVGENTPFIKYMKVYECSDNNKKPLSWLNISSPPPGLALSQNYQIVLEADVALHAEDFKMVFRTRLGGKW